MSTNDIRFTEIRMASYALLCAIERDLRGIIVEEIVSQFSDSTFLHESETKCIERYRKDKHAEKSYNPFELLEYLDFQESYTVIIKNRPYISENIYSEIKRLVPLLDQLVPIRNVVMHGRPIEYDDFLLLSNFCVDVPSSNGIRWTTLKRTIKELESNPAMLLKVEIPILKENDRILNNLPNPDFNDTGFIGRKGEVKELKELILGLHRVVSIIGDGGTGKTAIAVKVAYEILDDDAAPFDIIVWADAKQNILTEKGIKTIKEHLSSMSILSKAREVLTGSVLVENEIEEILGYLREFNVLLIIDNLETIINAEILDFIKEASKLCKILITSRIGLGELEFRKNLKGLSTKDSLQLFRQYSKYCGQTGLLKLPEIQLQNIVETRLYNNPLAIRWYVKCISSGTSPAETLGNIGELLRFCLSNVYSHLSSSEKLLLSILLVMRKETSEAELIYVSNLPTHEAKSSMNRLLSTSFITRNFESSSNGMICIFDIPEFARDYLILEKVVDKECYAKINVRKKQLAGSAQNARRIESDNFYDLNAISMNTDSEMVVGRILADVLRKSKNNLESLDTLTLELERAKSIVPGYIEIYRVSAFIKAENGDIFGAEQDYQTGLEIAPNNKRLLYFYCRFLLINMDDVSNAVDVAEQLYKLDNITPSVRIIYAKATGFNGNYELPLEILFAESKNEITGISKTRKIALNLYIEFSRRLALSQSTEKHDYYCAVKTIRRATHLFSERAVYFEIDEKISKTMSKLLNETWYILQRNSNHEQEEWFDNFIINHKELIFGLSPYVTSLRKPADEISNSPKEPHLVGSIFSLLNTYGFIITPLGIRIFFHISDCIDTDLSEGDKVEYEMGFNDKGQAAKSIKKMP